MTPHGRLLLGLNGIRIARLPRNLLCRGLRGVYAVHTEAGSIVQPKEARSETVNLLVALRIMPRWSALRNCSDPSVSPAGAGARRPAACPEFIEGPPLHRGKQTCPTSQSLHPTGGLGRQRPAARSRLCIKAGRSATRRRAGTLPAGVMQTCAPVGKRISEDASSCTSAHAVLC